ncbi:5'-nucleotidase C-terminal domain-containing protein [Haladaptatus sp. DFWS20]|uniref:5'-nucleotidase C-terminal domain-containing protein n=1 Tax=Haladaptatus sp. DFWS20 TaxID=3403467 RepID=UPI003EBEDA4E
MAPRLIYYSDIENAYDYPDRIGRLAGTIGSLRGEDEIVVGTGDNTAPGVLAEQYDGRQALDFFRAVEPAAETFGNHNFNFGLAATRELVADSPQPWICANVYDDDNRFAGVSPFAGDLCIASLDGGELYEMVDGVLSPIDATHDRIWRGQFSGMRVVYDPNRRQIQSVTVEGKTLDSNAEYTVATNRYVAVSGSDLTPITTDHISETWGVQYDAILEYARETPLDVSLDGLIESTTDD